MRTAVGRDHQALVMSGAFASAPSGAQGTTDWAPANFIGLTATVTAPADSDTALAGEIVTAGGGLIRKAATPARTAGASSYTLTAIFTANASDALPVTVAKIGVFTQLAIGGRMTFESSLSATATFSAIGDQLTVTETITQ